MIKEIMKKITCRYKAKIHLLNDDGAEERLLSMIDMLCDNANDWPVDKTSRWLGFIQGALWINNIIDINEERDFTRPLFHSYYESIGEKIPDSFDVEK